MPGKRKNPRPRRGGSRSAPRGTAEPPKHEPFRELLSEIAPVPKRPPEPPPPPPKPAAPVDPLDDPSLDDEALLLRELADVAPLGGGAADAGRVQRAPAPAPEPSAATTPPLDDMRRLADIFEAEAGAELGQRWVATGQDPRLANQLADGLFRPTRSLDLHGHGEAAAVHKARRFLQSEAERGSRCVAIIHGRGRHSVAAPVLAPAVREALRHMPTLVEAWSAARPEAGGEGVTLVLLTRS